MANIDTRLTAIADALDTLVTLANNHEQRIAALEECYTGAKTASNAQKRAVAPKSVKPATTTSKKSATTASKEYSDVKFTASADPKGLAIALEVWNKAARAYLRVRVLQDAKWTNDVKAYVFPNAKSYNAAVKRINALKGIVKQAEIAKFVANGWA